MSGAYNLCSNEEEARETPGPAATCGKPHLTMGRNCMDFIVELPESHGNTIIWMVINLFSKQAHFMACPSLPSACKLAKMFFIHIYCLQGVPQRIISDQGC